MAVVFVNEEDRRIFKELVLVLKTAGAPIPREIANSRYTTSVCVGRERKRKLSSSFSHGFYIDVFILLLHIYIVNIILVLR
uniref:Uncharacterized protein n=1 Tax=Zea mays TaxID=4577 RepID=B6UI59_MAIZE|nr:hypothetical protein [Zea mays]